MANTFNKDVFSSVYKDDYIKDKNFYKILYNSGRLSQAREFTQMQTIIQEQIARFGRNIFKEGAVVNPAGITINNTVQFIKLNSITYQLPEKDELIGSEFTGETSGIKFEIIDVLYEEGDDPSTLYVQYTNSSDDDKTINPGELISNGLVTLETQQVNTISNPAVGYGSTASISSGDMFVRGYFVAIADQTIYVSKYLNNQTFDIGFDVIEDIVTVAEDESLYDNSGDTLNLSAPGADRYRIRLQLTTKDNSIDPDNFIYYASIVDGDVVEDVQPEDDYNKINDLLALRTKEESGDYIVEPFTIKFDQSEEDESKLIIDISDGTAYVDGYRVEKVQHEQIEIDKARDLLSKNNDVIGLNFGNYVEVTDVSAGGSIPDLSSRPVLEIKQSSGWVMGWCRVTSVEKTSSGMRLYISDINLKLGQAFRDARFIGDFTLKLENNKGVITEFGNDNLLFALPYSRPANISDSSMVVQRSIEVSSSSSGEITMSLGNVNEVFADTSEWFVMDSSFNFPDINVDGTGTSNVIITGLNANTQYSVVYFVNISNAQSRNKILKEKTITHTSDVSPGDEISLGEADIYELVEVLDADGNDITDSFTLDNGQRPSLYDIGKVTVDNGSFEADLTIKFKYFEWSTVGNFFSVNSYSGQIPYEDIPNFTSPTGISVNLRSVLDFRGKVDASSNEFGSSGFDIPQNGDLIRSDVNYYMSRYAKLYVTSLGEFGIEYGKSSIEPKMPALSDDKILELYTILLNPYTLDNEDLTIIAKESKLFTMKDIGDLEKDVEELKETVSLSLLELETSTLKVLDADGNDRIKNGFFVDNFVDNTFCDNGNPEYRASVDPEEKILRPSFVENLIELEYDSEDSSGIVIKDDLAMLNYSNATYLSQKLKTGTENINPYAVVTSEGHMKLSPSSDSWMEVRYAPNRIIDGGTKIHIRSNRTIRVNENARARPTSGIFRTLFGRSRWGWFGRRFTNSTALTNARVSQIISDARRDPRASVSQSSSTSSTTRTTTSRRGFFLTRSSTTRTTTRRTTTRSTITRVVGSETVRKQVGDRVIDVDVIPWMRSKKIHFKVVGLRPNTRMYPFFDGKYVGAYCRSEPFKRMSERTTRERLMFATQRRIMFKGYSHPSGATPLMTDSNGEIEGTFVIPCNSRMKFRTGKRVFKLLDIAKNDDKSALTKAETTFSSSGLLQTRQRSILSTRHITKTKTTYITTRTTTTSRTTRRWRVDPLAQTFTVSNSKGMYLSEVDIFFKTKARWAPVRLEIRPVENGYPSSDTIVPGGAVFKKPSSITTSNDGSKATTFKFDAPVYLNGDTEYAVVLLADTTEYNVYVAETYEFLLGSNKKRVSKQPTMGSLFKSQNGSTWTADQNKDLTFVLRRAKFANSTNARLAIKNGDIPEEHLEIWNPIQLTAGDRVARIYHPGHGMHVDDYMEISGLDDSKTYGGIAGSVINGRHHVIDSDLDGYTVLLSTAPTKTVRVGADDVYCTRNYQFNIINPNIQTTILEGTSIATTGSFTYGKSYAGNETPYSYTGEYEEIELGENNEYNVPLLVANDLNENHNIGRGEPTLKIRLSMKTTSDWISPVVDLERIDALLTENIIDNQHETATIGFNKPFEYFPETDSWRGTAACKHITTPITLEDDAVGIKVLMGVNNPPEANIKLFYRTSVAGEDLYEKDWIEDLPEENMPSDENRDIYRQWEYIIGGPEGALTPFNSFQLKIVMNSTNSSRYPTIKDLRTIALGV